MKIDYQKLFKRYMKDVDHLILILSQDLTIQDINPLAEKILNWKKETVCHKKIYNLFKELSIQPFFYKEDALKKHTNITYVPHQNKHLKIVWDIVPIYNEDQADYTIFIVGRNTTEPTNEQLENLQLDNVLKYAPGLFYWKDKNSIYQGCNDEFAKLAGLKSRDEVIGRSDYELIWKERAHLYVDIDQKVIQAGRPILNVEEAVTITKNRTMTAITNKVPLRDNDGQVIGLLGITMDITHQKEVEHELSLAKEAAETANFTKTEFIANMSHDIRTPLTGVVGISSLLEEQATDPQLKQYAKDIQECGEQLLNMLNGILDIVSADRTNEVDIIKETFDLRQCVNEIMQLEKPTTVLHKLDLIVNYDDRIPPYLMNDRTKIHRILLNLVSNAVKFTPKGTITIEVKLLDIKDNQAQVYFAVSDTGIGIPLDQQDKVFDRFFRATPSYKGLYKGHGVGLHIAQSYANLLGATIKLNSQKDVGTTFYFELSSQIGSAKNTKVYDSPVAPAPTHQPIFQMASETEDHPHHYPKLLLIEDNRIALKVIESIVKNAGFPFKTAIDGESALELATSHTFDLIITDLGLPGMSGHEFTKQLRNWELLHRKAPTPIIGLTAHAETSIRKQSLATGMNDLLSKPLTMPALQSIIFKFLAHKLMLEENQTQVSIVHGRLGPDLPSREYQLFELGTFPLFNLDTALKNMNADKVLLNSMLKTFIRKDLPMDKIVIETAYTLDDWEKIAKMAHKMKSGVIYLGLIKMQHACQYLERYHKAGHTKLLKRLYVQMMLVFDETHHAIQSWLKSN